MRPNQYKKILIIRLSSLGDIILTTPLIRSLKKSYPGVALDYCVREEYADVLRLNPHINELIIYTKQEARIAEIHEKIEAAGYDAIIDLQNNYRSTTLLKGIKRPVFKFKKHTFLKLLLVRFKLNLMSRLPQIPDRYARAFHHFQLDNEGLELFTPDDVKTIIEPSDKIIGFCPGSRHYTKMWPFDYYIELGEILKLHGYRVMVFGGKMETQLCKTIAELIPNAINAGNNDDFYQTVANMRLCRAIVTNDTGLMHIAAALQKPTIAMFGSSVREFGFTPYKTLNDVLEVETLRCRPCSHIGRATCPKGHFECMMRLSPVAVYQNLSYLLSKS